MKPTRRQTLALALGSAGFALPAHAAPNGARDCKAPDTDWKAGIEGQVSRITNRAGARAEMATLSWKDLIERGYLVAGSPATVADRINDMADKLNVGHLMTLLHFGNMSKETTTYNTRMFAEKVIPRLRSRFSEWDDNWFPRDAQPGLAPRVVPEPVA